jgi:hypothetical protein
VNAALANKMTAKRADVLLAALARAEDEWQAEADGFDQVIEWSEGAHKRAARREQREIETKIEILTAARAVLVARFPAMRSSS